MSSSTLPARLSAPARPSTLEGRGAVGGVDDQLGAGGRVGEGGQADARVRGRARRRTAGCPCRPARCGPGSPAGRGCRRSRRGRARARRPAIAWPTMPVPRTAMFMVVPSGGARVDRSVYRCVDASRQICLLSSAWPLPSARQRILDTAFRLFYAHGLRAVGVDTDHRRVGRRQGHLLQALPGQGRPGARLPRQGRRDLEPAAARGGRGRRPGPARTSWSGCSTRSASACRRDGYHGCAFINAAAEATPGTPVHDRTVAHKRDVLAWVRGLAAEAGAADPGRAGPLADPAARRRAGQRGARRRPGLRRPRPRLRRAPGRGRPTVTGRPRRGQPAGGWSWPDSSAASACSLVACTAPSACSGGPYTV